MGKAFFKVSTFMLVTGFVALHGAEVFAACAPAGGSCSQILQSAQECQQLYSEQMQIAAGQDGQARSLQGAALNQSQQTLDNTGGGANLTAGGANAGADESLSQSNVPASGCVQAAATAEEAAKTHKDLMKAAAQAGCGSGGKGPDIAKATKLKKTCEDHLADNGKLKSGMGNAALPLAALAAGALAGMMMGGDKGGEKPPEEEEETPPVVPTEIDPDSCGANAVLENGICVVKSDEDKCYLADGTTVDKTKLRNSKGVCVAKNELCEAGYSYNDAQKVCKKSNCQEGFTENASGACVAINNTGGGSIGLPAPDPIFGDTPETEEEATTISNDPSKVRGAASVGGASSGSSGSSRGAASYGSGRDGGSSGSAGGSAYASGGGSGADGKEASSGKDAQVQYQPLKWKNPKKTKSLREVISER